MSIGEVKAALEEANQLLSEGKSSVEGVGEALSEVAGLMLATLHDSRRAEAEDARKAVAAAIREVKLTLRTIDAAQASGTEYGKALG